MIRKMFGFPHFLTPWFAAAAAAIAIPSLLVLYFLKLRRRELAVSSTLLWKKAIQDLQVNAPFQKLRRNLLLVLQLLLLALLCLALSRPVVNFTPGAGKVSVILIDRSASMSATDINGKSRLDEAKRRAKELVGTLDRHATAMIIAFDDGAEAVQPFTSDANALRTAIDSIKPTDRKSRLKVAYQLAEAQSFYMPEQMRANKVKPDVFLYSDGRVLDANEVSIYGEVHYDKIGTDTAPNIAIVSLSAKRNYERPTEVQVFARLVNYGVEPVKADVQLSVDNQVKTIAAVSLLPERWTDQQRENAPPAQDSVEFKLDLLTSAVIKVEQMNKEHDCLAADDVAQVVVPPPKTLKVALVTDGNYFLEKALNSLNLEHPMILLPTAYEQKGAADADVVIFDRYTPKRLPPAGGFIYFDAVPPDSKLPARTETGPDKLVMIQDIAVLDWKRDHPILRYLSLGKLYVAEAIKLNAPLDAEVLIDGLKGPLIVMQREGKSTHLVVGFDLLQSNWPLKVSFPIFLHNALQYLAVGSEMDVRQAYEPGATPRIARANVDRVQLGLKKIRMNGPTGSRDLALPDAGDFALPALDKVGVYVLDPPVPQFEQLAVNLLDANESNLVASDKAPGGVGTEVANTGGKARLDLWWWIVAVVALPLLMVEWWVYTRRVHL